MNPSNPQWYDALQGEPLKKRTFTRELADKIRSQAIKPANRKPFSAAWATMISTAAIVGVAAMLILVSGQELFQRGNQAEASQARAAGSDGTLNEQAVQLAGDMAEVQELVLEEPAEADPMAIPKEWSGHPILVPTLAIAEPTDEEWQQLLNESFPNFPTEILFKEKFGNDLMLIFSKKVNVTEGYTGVSLNTNKLEWTDSRWKWTTGFSHSPHENLQEELNADLLMSWYGVDLIPLDPTTTITMFSGVVVNPNITEIRVIDDQDQKYMAQLLPSDDGFTYFFTALPPGKRGSYKLEGVDASGQIIYSEVYTYH
jgi:hypothetical protein